MDTFESKTYHNADAESPPPSKEEYGQVAVDDTANISAAEHTSLHRGLKARHITMIAIGGAIGTGLIIGTCVRP